MEEIVVKMLRPHAANMPGDVCSFEPSIAERLVKTGAAELLELTAKNKKDEKKDEKK
jgi:hypothetical protein